MFIGKSQVLWIAQHLLNSGLKCLPGFRNSIARRRTGSQLPQRIQVRVIRNPLPPGFPALARNDRFVSTDTFGRSIQGVYHGIVLRTTVPLIPTRSFVVAVGPEAATG